VPPTVYDFRINEQNADYWASYIGQKILNNERRPVFDWQKETVQMLGRWQPWHKGHRALFERALAKTGQVCIMIRDCQGWQGSNPFAMDSSDMQRRFETALEATKVVDELHRQLRTINYNKDLHKFLKNVEGLISVLGSAEVKARQTHRPNYVDEPRENLANAIDYLEKMILIAKLSE
jgi:uncharacterized protein YnzC (UPF0291/DUF896 family)